MMTQLSEGTIDLMKRTINHVPNEKESYMCQIQNGSSNLILIVLYDNLIRRQTSFVASSKFIHTSRLLSALIIYH